MTSHYPPAPPVSLESVRLLVMHAQAVVAYLKQERQEAEARGRNFPQAAALIDGWDFVAVALAETYDAPDLLS